MLCQSTSNPGRLRDLFTRTTLVLMLVAAFTGAWLVGTRYDLVALGLGAQWARVPPLLAVVALTVPAAAFYSIAYNTWYALGRTGLLLKVSMLNTVLSLPVLAFVVRYGLGPVAWVWVASQCFVALLNFAGLVHIIKPPLRQIAFRTVGLLSTGATAVLVMSFVRHGTLNFLPLLPRFIVCSMAGTVVYGAIIWVTQRDIIDFVLRMSRGTAAVATGALSNGSENDKLAGASEETCNSGPPAAAVGSARQNSVASGLPAPLSPP